MTEHRTGNFRRNEMLEKLLTDINSNLQLSEQALLQSRITTPTMNYPLILVMGPLRSGTTLFMQWLANSRLVAYPTNLMSRFYQVPIIGSKIQLMLTDPNYRFRDELCEFLHQVEYRSDNGKTKGTLAPNEFWYFWRRFLPDANRDVWTDEELSQSMDTRTMLAELAGIMEVFRKPFAAKGMLFNYNIPFLDSVFEKVLFVHVTRDEEDNAASVLDARKRQMGDVRAWYSFDIPEKVKLSKLDPFEQALGQVKAINQAVGKGLLHVESSRKMIVQYERFCREPSHYFKEIVSKLEISRAEYNGPQKFVSNEKTKTP